MLVCASPDEASYGPRKGFHLPGNSTVRHPDFQPEKRGPGQKRKEVVMPDSKLPERASLEYLKKQAKARLRELRSSDPKAKLSRAQLSLAREYGFPSWRALKAEVELSRARHTS